MLTVESFLLVVVVASLSWDHMYLCSLVFQDIPYAEWKKMLAVHMDGCFLMTRAAVREMKARKTSNGTSRPPSPLS